MNEKSIIIKFVKEEAQELDQKGKVQRSLDVNGNPRFVRNDIMGLTSLLSKFDTRRHAINDWKLSIKIKDKMIKCFLDNAPDVELTVAESIFLRTYLKELKDKEAQSEKLNDFELRTLFGLEEQLGIV